MPPRVPQPGDTLLGKYRVERVLGSGGMGVVVSAVHLQLGQRFAIKFLLVDTAKQPEVIARFLREAQAAGGIRSEHVARVVDVGTLPEGTPYLVMEHLSGQDLAARIAERGPLPIGDAVEYVLQACEALAEAHSLGIIHRDLKPANLFVTRRADGSPLVKVIDFGISKATVTAPSAASLTATAGVLGSPYYMSPEQVRSAKSVDARSDIWSLGVILYELLTGRPPFEAEGLYALFRKIDVEAPAGPCTRRRDVPTGLEAAVLRCLEKEPERRYQSIAGLAEALGPFAPPLARVSIERISRVLGAPLDSTAAESAPTNVMLQAVSFPAPFDVAPARESTPTSDEDATAIWEPPEASNAPGRTAQGWGRTGERREPSRRALGIGAGVVAICAALGWVGVRMLSATDASVDRSSDVASVLPSAASLSSSEPRVPSSSASAPIDVVQPVDALPVASGHPTVAPPRIHHDAPPRPSASAAHRAPEPPTQPQRPQPKPPPDAVDDGRVWH